MSIKEQVPMSRTSITIVVVILLCAAGLVYSQGWFGWSSPDMEMESSKVSANQALDQEKTNADAAKLTQRTTEPVATPTE